MSRSSIFFQSHKSNVKKKMEFHIFVTTVSGTQETKSFLTTKPICVIQRSCQGYPHHAVSSEFPEDISMYKSMNTIKCQFMWYNRDTRTIGQ